jgi:hypothetical protein
MQTHHPTKHRHRLKSSLFMHTTNLEVYDLNWIVQHVHKQIGWTYNACMKEFQIRKWQKDKITCQVWLLLVSLTLAFGPSSHPKTRSQPNQIPQTNRSFYHKHLHVKASSKIQVTKYSSSSHGHVEALLCGLTSVIKLLCTRCERPWDLSKIALFGLKVQKL